MSTPHHPQLLAVYDAVELATGVALRDGLLAITNRHFGVELVDVKDPRRPRFLASMVTGEAQSVTIDGSFAYVGNWLDQTLAVLDIAEPGAPRLLARVQLDGFGDGVAVQGDVCAVATGHHDRQQTDPRRWDGQPFVTTTMLRDGYGGGHGVELWSASHEPELLSRLKNPRSFVGSPDTWRVAWVGDHLINADSNNGVFVIDAADPCGPRHVAFSRLPLMQDREASSPRIQQLRHPATGLATAGTSIYVASPSWQLAVIESAIPAHAEQRRPITVRPSGASSTTPKPIRARRVQGSAGGSHINEIALVDPDTVAAACGEQGIALLDPDDLRVPDRQRSPGLVHHVAPVGSMLYAAAGSAGIGLYRVEDRRLVREGAVDIGAVVRQVVPMPDEPVALALVDGGSVALLDISDEHAPTLIDTTPLGGMIYGRILPEGSYAGHRAAAVSLGGGVSWLTLSEAPPTGRRLASTGRRLCPITEGAAQLSDQNLLLVRDGGYELLSPGSTQLAGRHEMIRPTGPRLSGVPTIIGRALVVTNRASGGVRILDITHIERPQDLARLRVDGTPGRPLLTSAGLLMPCGRAGVQRLPLDPGILGLMHDDD